MTITFADILGTPRARKIKLTSAQKSALAAYNECLRQEDRYFGFVAANAVGAAEVEGKTKAAYAHCKALGMTHEHGL